MSVSKTTQSQTQTLVPLNPSPSPEMDCRINTAIILFSNNQSKLAENLILSLPRDIGQRLLLLIWKPSPTSGPNQTVEEMLSLLFEAKKKEFAALSEKWKPYHTSQYGDVSQKCRSQPLKSLTRSHCYDAKLVKLKNNCLNAHLVLGGKYILTEHPKSRSFASYWQMIDEFDVPVIFMLNQNNEDNCRPYYPKKMKATKECGPYSVTMTHLSSQKIFYASEKREFTIASIKTLHYSRDKGKGKQTNLIHFRYWPDGGIPIEEELRYFIGLKRQFLGASQAPVVIHCKKGIGRTGVYCVIDYLFPLAEELKPFSVLSVVEQLRHPETGRHPLMVPHEEQYLFCYSFLWDESRTPHPQEEEVAIPSKDEEKKNSDKKFLDNEPI